MGGDSVPGDVADVNNADPGDSEREDCDETIETIILCAFCTMDLV